MIMAAMVIDVSLTDGVKIGLDHHEARSKTMHQASITGFETRPPIGAPRPPA
jgi:hypothetical protein